MRDLTLEEVLPLFNNGETRYAEDPNFKEAVDSLRAGIGVYAVLDKTLNQLRVLRDIHSLTLFKGRQLADEVASYKDALELTSRPMVVDTKELYPGELLQLRARSQQKP
jgi:hypothetical protein